MFQTIIYKINHILQKNNITADINGRIKQPSSILYKIIKKKVELKQLNDIYALRIIVTNEDECYQVLQIVHILYQYDRKKYKDYISSPKRNGYQSIHTVIFDKDTNKKLEIQIRDYSMHEYAEYGPAAHKKYKARYYE